MLPSFTPIRKIQSHKFRVIYEENSESVCLHQYNCKFKYESKTRPSLEEQTRRAQRLIGGRNLKIKGKGIVEGLWQGLDRMLDQYMSLFFLSISMALMLLGEGRRGDRKVILDKEVKQ